MLPVAHQSNKSIGQATQLPLHAHFAWGALAGFEVAEDGVVAVASQRELIVVLAEPEDRRGAVGSVPLCSASRLVGALLPLAGAGLLSTVGAGGMYASCAALLLAVLVRVLGPRTNSHRLDSI